jgi:hypothetical protein
MFHVTVMTIGLHITRKSELICYKQQKLHLLFYNHNFSYTFIVLSDCSDAVCLLMLSKPYDSQLHAEFVTDFFSQFIINPPITITQTDFI